MEIAAARVEIKVNAERVFHELGTERRQTLVGPEDDMWATFAELAKPHALLVDGEVAGCCSIDGEDQLHSFFIRDEYEEMATELLTQLVLQTGVVAAVPSTLDPAFMSQSLTIGGAAEPVALLFDRVIAGTHAESIELRTATDADLADAVTHNREATDSSDDFLVPYLSKLIERGELYLSKMNEQIAATGECRVDRRTSGYAHLGLIVRADLRAQGIGTRVMSALTEICTAQNLAPLCSTEPSNVAAQRVIHRAGFRGRHRVFRVSMSKCR